MHISTLFLTLGMSALVSGAYGADADNDRTWAAIGSDGVQRIHIRCGANFLDPNHIVIKANVPVELTVSTTAGLPSHSFVISMSGPRPITADTPIEATEKTFAFVPGRPGDYQASCRDNTTTANAALLKAKQGLLTVIP
jgi:hypothetical protein